MARHLRLTTLLLVLSFSLGPVTAEAQYFGRNKVQYKTFNFEILKTEHFDVYFYPEERQAAEISARLAERWHARLSRMLGFPLVGRQPLILYASHPDFEQTNVIPGQLGESTGGVTEGQRRRIVLPLAGPLSETDHVIGHELVHAFQYNAAVGRQAGGAVTSGLENLPLWFVEGMAEYLSIGPQDPHTAMWMRDAIAENRLPKNLDNPDFFPYRWGHAWWAYVAGRYGDAAVGNLLKIAKATGDPEAAIKEGLGVEPKELMNDWHAALRATYGASLQHAEKTTTYGTLLVGDPKQFGGEVNVSPALSPDGSRVAFLSERSLFSIELYLADATTGEILRRLTSTATDPHVTSLQFIRSAGAWSPDGRQLVVPAVEAGRPALLVINGDNGDRVREITLPQLHEVYNPAWSPDGRTIAFAANVGGLTDLFTYEIQTDQLRRLTDDAYTELQPAWSPDGGSIAFATDRFTSDLDQLRFGQYRLAVISADGRGLREVPSPGSGKSINPQYSTDGARLFFLSDANGATNVFAVDLRSGELRQITNLATGISGITASSPALSVAARANRLVVSAYENDAYRIYNLEQPQVLAGRPAVDVGKVVSALPPLERRTLDVARLVENPQFGLPRQREFPVQDYRPSLGLDYISQPTFAAGVDRFGTFGGGGIALVWGDMLGDHNLTTAFQVDSSLSRNFSFKDTSALVAYQNVKHRWNWGAAVQQVPYLSGGISAGFTEIDGQQVAVERTFISREINQAFTGLVSYPFNRAQRLDFSAGIRRIGFDQEVLTSVFDPNTGQLLAETSETLPSRGALNLAQASAALVYDTSTWGPTSPLLGQAYRLEVTPLAGSITFANVLADYRRYFMPAQFYTIAARVVHYGRYGADAEHPLLYPLYIGYPNLVRGYDVGSFSADECPAVGNECPAFDRLLGSRMLVGNIELRFPLFRPFGLSRRMYGPLPLELALFADSGVAWNQGERLDFFRHRETGRKPVSSYGVGLRANLLGFTVAQIDFVRPIDRPQKGWIFQFSLSPGF